MADVSFAMQKCGYKNYEVLSHLLPCTNMGLITKYVAMKIKIYRYIIMWTVKKHFALTQFLFYFFVIYGGLLHPIITLPPYIKLKFICSCTTQIAAIFLVDKLNCKMEFIRVGNSRRNGPFLNT